MARKSKIKSFVARRDELLNKGRPKGPAGKAGQAVAESAVKGGILGQRVSRKKKKK